MRIKQSSILPFSLLSFAIALLSACGSDNAPNNKQQENLARPAKLLQVRQTNSNIFLNYPAIIKSQQLSALSFEVGGTVKELPVIEAQQVKKGEILAKLDQQDLLAKLSSARAQFKNANTEYQRAVRLMKADAISKSELDKRKSQRDVNKSALESAQKALANSVLLAPYAGAISKVSIKINQIVQAGSPAIDILGRGGLEATINLPSSIMAKATKQRAQKDNAYIVLEAATDLHIPITFKEAALEADAVSQTYAVTFKFEAPENLIILPGMNAVIWFKDPSKADEDTNKIRIPFTAVAINGSQKYVWVVDNKSMTVSKRNIVIESDVGSSIAVNSGLESGETIVAAGVSALLEGMKVSAWSK